VQIVLRNFDYLSTLALIFLW